MSPVLKKLVGNGLGYVVQDFDRNGSPMELKRRTNNFIGNLNTRLKLFCEANKLKKVTTYSARHTFASLMKAQGMGTAMISELLGHSSAKTTENYLRRFDFETKKKAVGKILKFKVA